MKKKRIIAAIFAAFGAILIIHSCSRAGAGVSALAVDTNITLTTAQTLALFGDTINCEYLSTAGIYKPLTLTYEGNHHIVSENQSNSLGVTVADRDFIAYRALMPSDIDVTPSNMRISIETACDLSGVTYVDTAFLQMTNLSLGTILQTSYPNNYWYTSAGYFRSAGQTNDPDLFGYCVNTYNLNFTIIPVMYSAQSASDFKFGYISASSFNNYTVNDGYSYFGIVCPILSDGYTHSGNTGAGSGGSSGTGSDSGGSVDLSGVTSRLDSILEKLDHIIANQESNSSSSGSGDEPSALDSPPPSFDAAAAWSAADGAFHNPFSGSSGGGYDLGLSLPDSGSSGGGSASPPVDPTPPDESDMGAGLAAVWFLISYIFGTFPWLATLTTFSLSVGVAVFIIFHGKGSE